MTSPERRVPSPVAPIAEFPAERVAVRPVAVPPASARCPGPVGRGPRSAAPATSRRDPARPGARPTWTGGPAVGRPVRGGCSVEGGQRPVARAAGVAGRDEFTPIRLTERGRRVVAGLSIAVGLSIAAVTVVTVQLTADRGGLELAGSSTVVVQQGDTLWSLAQELAPEEDPRAVVDAIVDLNGLEDVDLLPGAVLQLP
ncbi:LysM peptidoglycan-binding domain-containing protein [Modestobacter altitudinis]|uniref:LysM peptidoglycan-binding domain-containing protein n=1 Tax=Modestobacter altitudinis TaxID=2213158 RepID=UPI001C552C7B|nr:LysM peptidoglycan-binding domain-containing protein [Modestobacter altitudinis]